METMLNMGAFQALNEQELYEVDGGLPPILAKALIYAAELLANYGFTKIGDALLDPVIENSAYQNGFSSGAKAVAAAQNAINHALAPLSVL